MRFMTYEARQNNYEIAAISEAEWKALSSEARKALDDDIDCYIWQEAPDATTAIAQHIDKHTEWENDINSGRPPKDTY